MAETTLPEPERIFWRKEVLYLTPLPPQHLAEVLPDS
jgi:hypothetical protein